MAYTDTSHYTCECYEYKLHLGGILIFEFVEKKWLSIYALSI